MPRRLASLSLILLATTYGCRDSGVLQDNGTLHPVADSLPSPTTARNDLEQVAPTHLSQEANWDTLGATVIGTLEGPASSALGTVTRVRLTGSEVLILDGLNNEIRRFAVDGSFLGYAAGPGPGPGELTVARGMDVSGDGRLFVGDERRVIHVYAPSDTAWVLEREIPTDITILDLCVIGSQLLVLGVTETSEASLHLVDSAGSRVREIATPYRHDDIFMRFLLAEGQLVCDAGRDAVYIAFARMPEIQAYDLNGGLLWASRASPYDQMAIVEYADGTSQLGQAAGSESFHLLVSLESLGDSLVAQYGFYDSEGIVDEEYGRLDSVVLSKADGGGGRVDQQIPRVVVAGEHGLILAKDFPYPQILIPNRIQAAKESP